MSAKTACAPRLVRLLAAGRWVASKRPAGVAARYPLRTPRRPGRRQVDDEGDDEQQDADDEQHLVVVEPAGRLAELGGDVAVRVRTESNTLVGMLTAWPVAISTAMVSPTRGRRRAARRPAGRSWPPAAAPVDESASGVAPSASAASRYESGTAFSASSPIETMIGTLIRPG
jgi:hypothetical protein